MNDADAGNTAAISMSSGEAIDVPSPPAACGLGKPRYAGLATVVADLYGDGYGDFRIRADLRESYLAAYRQVRALGGILTSSGAIRSLTASVTPGRSRTSLHYTGRAIDLFIRTGMQGSSDRYLVARDGGSPDHPLWTVYCTSVDPNPADPAYDESFLCRGRLEYVVWRHGRGYVTGRRVARYFSLTAVLASHGWQHIPAASDWRTNYLSCEWWHFQHPGGLVDGISSFRAELLRVWPAELIDRSGMAIDAIWSDGSFR